MKKTCLCYLSICLASLVYCPPPTTNPEKYEKNDKKPKITKNAKEYKEIMK
jgi:hypothetical protein